MKDYFLIFSLILISCTSTRKVFSAKNVEGDILIQNVNIVDVENNKLLQSQDVLIRDKRIVSISKYNRKRLHATVTINGEGKFLIPGLWDMHVHTFFEDWFSWQIPLFIANGIIGFRDMFGRLPLADSIRLEMQKEHLPFLHFAVSGHIIDGKKAYWPGSLAVANPPRAESIVDSLMAAGSSFIKVYSFMEPDVFQAIAKRCREKNFPFAGHVPNRVWLTDASKAGMASMEHLYGFLTEACSFPDSAMNLLKKSTADFEAGVAPEVRNQNSRAGQAFMLDHFSEDRMRNIAKVLRENNTYIVPTLVTLRGNYYRNDTAFAADDRLKYMSKATLDYWKELTEDNLKMYNEEDWQNKRKRWQIEQKMIKILWEEKVPILAGTDSDNPYAFPGFSIHDELALFVEFGMKPIDALRTATINPVKYLNMTDSLGTIEKGKRADVVLLNANPLLNINNTKNINAVISNGKIYTSGNLEALKQEVVKKNLSNR
jgi:hypothetical protein